MSDPSRNTKVDTRRSSDTWWAPHARDWWIGVLFMIGAACFALGAAPRYAGAVGGKADGITYFVGSLFFTSAALLQMLEGLHLPTLDRWGGIIQFAGTIFFNFSTAHALITNLNASETDNLVWRPDAFGSICFLVASQMAYMAVGHAWASWRPREIGWWTAALNMLGSIAFGVSAVASYVIVDSGLVRNVERANLGTFIGALCFLVGAFLLLPARTLDAAGVDQ